jgi:hypothetical protein
MTGVNTSNFMNAQGHMFPMTVFLWAAIATAPLPTTQAQS